MADSLAPEAVEPLLRGRLGRPYLYRERCDAAHLLLDPSLPEGATAVCEMETDPTWQAPAGAAILCSILVRPPREYRPPELSLMSAVALAEAVEAALGLSAQIKWPNDVMVDRQKVAGVVVEARDGAAVLGIRLNVNQTRAELPAAGVPAASLVTIGARRLDRAPLLADLLVRLERTYDRWCGDGLDGVYVGLGSRDFLRGRKVSVDGQTGVAVAVDRAGRLEVDLDGERRLVESGGVTYER